MCLCLCLRPLRLLALAAYRCGLLLNSVLLVVNACQLLPLLELLLR
jgi:hypothetical protein